MGKRVVSSLENRVLSWAQKEVVSTVKEEDNFNWREERIFSLENTVVSSAEKVAVQLWRREKYSLRAEQRMASIA